MWSDADDEELVICSNTLPQCVPQQSRTINEQDKCDVSMKEHGESEIFDKPVETSANRSESDAEKQDEMKQGQVEIHDQNNKRNEEAECVDIDEKLIEQPDSILQSVKTKEGDISVQKQNGAEKHKNIVQEAKRFEKRNETRADFENVQQDETKKGQGFHQQFEPAKEQENNHVQTDEITNKQTEVTQTQDTTTKEQADSIQQQYNNKQEEDESVQEHGESMKVQNDSVKQQPDIIKEHTDIIQQQYDSKQEQPEHGNKQDESLMEQYDSVSKEVDTIIEQCEIIQQQSQTLKKQADTVKQCDEQDEITEEEVETVKKKAESVQQQNKIVYDHVETIPQNDEIKYAQAESVQQDQQTTEMTSTKEQDFESKKSKLHRKRKRVQTRKKLRYLDYSSDDIPLSMYKDRTHKKLPLEDSFDDTDQDKTFIPDSKDLNSTDTEYYSDLSEKTKMERNRQDSIKQSFNKTSDKRKRHSTRKERKQSQSPNQNKCYSEQISKAMEISQTEEVFRGARIKASEGRIDQLLKSNGLSRMKVPPHGNCFFEAVLKSKEMNYSPVELRQVLCQHLEDNIEEYMGFLINVHNPQNEETFVMEYLQEIENLKQDGYWSSRVADFLPLALSNVTGFLIKIYTSKPDQPIINIQPTLKQSTASETITIAYISVPQIVEHYDACENISSSTKIHVPQTPNASDPSENKGYEYTATPLLTSPTPAASSPVDVISPRKKAKFVTPKKKKLYRKRKSTPENWKRNVRKRLKLSGQEYTSTTGKTVKERKVKPCDCTKCRYSCDKKISEEQRNEIFKSYWSLNSYERQKDIICSCIEEKQTRTFQDDNGTTISKRKNVARRYSFKINEETFRVCKKFFLTTLNLGEAYVNNAMKYKSCGRFAGEDRRGKHSPHNKLDVNILNDVRDHISSFPKVSGHYTRKDSNREFLGADLTLPKMYSLYKEKCKSRLTEPVKLAMYRKVFNEEFNLSFHVPKKDQCSLCSQYENANIDCTLTEDLKERYHQHQSRKTMAREEKMKDKILAKNNSTIHTCTFDLQAVLYTPCSLVSVMYYMRKLCCYNLSVYSLGNGKGSCFLWSEIDGMRGSNEIGTCLRLYLLSLPSTVEQVILYSDSCTGQNRNSIIATALLHVVSYLPQIKMIDHKFLESGHTHMECDSMHAAIEFAKKKTQINVPSQWDTVITMARRKDPYAVVPLKYTDILDFKRVKEEQIKMQTKSEEGNKVTWTKMKWLRFVKEKPHLLYFKYDIRDEFQCVRMLNTKTQNCLQEALPSKYKHKLQISMAKKRDLVNICKSGVIPREYHDYYKNLPSSQSVVDKLPEPDAEEDSGTDNE